MWKPLMSCFHWMCRSKNLLCLQRLWSLKKKLNTCKLFLCEMYLPDRSERQTDRPLWSVFLKTPLSGLHPARWECGPKSFQGKRKYRFEPPSGSARSPVPLSDPSQWQLTCVYWTSVCYHAYKIVFRVWGQGCGPEKHSHLAECSPNKWERCPEILGLHSTGRTWSWSECGPVHWSWKGTWVLRNLLLCGSEQKRVTPLWTSLNQVKQRLPHSLWFIKEVENAQQSWRNRLDGKDLRQCTQIWLHGSLLTSWSWNQPTSTQWKSNSVSSSWPNTGIQRRWAHILRFTFLHSIPLDDMRKALECPHGRKWSVSVNFGVEWFHTKSHQWTWNGKSWDAVRYPFSQGGQCCSDPMRDGSDDPEKCRSRPPTAGADLQARPPTWAKEAAILQNLGSEMKHGQVNQHAKPSLTWPFGSKDISFMFSVSGGGGGVPPSPWEVNGCAPSQNCTAHLLSCWAQKTSTNKL